MFSTTKCKACKVTLVTRTLLHVDCLPEFDVNEDAAICSQADGTSLFEFQWNLRSGIW